MRKARECELATLDEKSTSSGIAEPYARQKLKAKTGAGERTTPVTTACPEAGKYKVLLRDGVDMTIRGRCKYNMVNTGTPRLWLICETSDLSRLCCVLLILYTHLTSSSLLFGSLSPRMTRRPLAPTLHQCAVNAMQTLRGFPPPLMQPLSGLVYLPPLPPGQALASVGSR